MATRLAASVVLVSVLSLLVATVVGIRTGRSLSRDLDEQRLEALQASGASNVAAHLRSLASSASALAVSPQTELALLAFKDGHRELLEDASSTPSADRDALVADYQMRYVEPLRPIRPETQLREVLPDNAAGRYLQARYALPADEVGEPGAVDDAGDGSSWSETHAVVHPVYREIVEQLGLVDLYLIELDREYVVYSVHKRPDLGTSLVTGPFSGSVLATAVDEVRRDPQGGTVISDLGYYIPTLTKPVGFVTAPVLSGGRLVGFLVLVYDGGPLNDLLSAGGDWDGGGYPPTGETLLFGGDGRVRTEPRSFVEDPAAHVSAAVESGMSDDERRLIRATGSTVLIESVTGSTLDSAIDGDRSVAERPNLLGVPVLSVVGSVPLPDLDWFVVAEVQVEAAEENPNDFIQLLIVGVAIIVVVIAFTAVGWARRLVRPVREISDQLGPDRVGLVDVDVPSRSPGEFHELANSFASMDRRIAEQRQRIADTRRERLALLRRMLPPAVAERIAAGQAQTVDEVPQASVVVVVVLGLGDLVRRDATANRDIIDRLLADLDELASRRQLDRTKVVGDAYFAACGHDRPFIDHAPRAVAFALDAREAIWAIGRESDQPLDLTAGVHSGPVMAGATGERAVYDVWGETVTTAHYLARQGQPGEIAVSDDTRALLPDTFELAPRPDGENGEIWLVATESVRAP